MVRAALLLVPPAVVIAVLAAVLVQSLESAEWAASVVSVLYGAASLMVSCSLVIL